MPPELPLEPGQEVTLRIDNLAFGGDGVGRHDNIPIFVPFVCPDEQVTATITVPKKRHAHAVASEVTAPAPERVPPPCPVYGACGGCQLQHLDYAAATAAKTRMVADVLARVGKLPDVPVHETIASPVPFGYRNKIELAAVPAESGGIDLCYHGVDPDDRIPVVDCPLALPEVNVLLEAVTAWLDQAGWPVYDEETTEGLIRSAAIRYSTSTQEANVLLTTGRRDVPDKVAQINALREAYPQIVGVRHVARTRASTSTSGRSVGEMYGRPMNFKVLDISLRVSPEAFFQVNDLLLPMVYEKIAAALEPRHGDHLTDLYGGVGTFGIRLAKEVNHVTLLEIDRTAVQDAKANARYNKAVNLDILRGQVEQQLTNIHEQHPIHTVVLDPPRRGCSPGVLTALAKIRPRRIAYLSCDPPTLARDLKLLSEQGFRTLEVQPFDMFPQTAQIEALATIEPK